MKIWRIDFEVRNHKFFNNSWFFGHQETSPSTPWTDPFGPTVRLNCTVRKFWQIWTLNLRPESLLLLGFCWLHCAVSLFRAVILKLISVKQESRLMPVFFATFQECTVCSALISARQEIKTHLSEAVRDRRGLRVCNSERSSAGQEIWNISTDGDFKNL